MLDNSVDGKLINQLYSDLWLSRVVASAHIDQRPFDYSDNNNHGVRVGVADGPNFWLFNGSSDAIQLGNNSNLNDLYPVTYSIWFIINDLSVAHNLFIKNDTGGAGGQRFIQVQADGAIRFNVRYSGTNLSRYSDVGLIQVGELNHLVVTWDGSTPESSVNIYLNGSEVGYQSGSAASGSYYSDAAASLDIPTSMLGYIFNYAIYNKIITLNQIQQLSLFYNIEYQYEFFHQGLFDALMISDIMVDNIFAINCMLDGAQYLVIDNVSKLWKIQER